MDAPHRPILVALGSEARALRLIQAGFRLAQERSAPWIAVHVETGGHPTEDSEQVQVWLQEAQRLGAEIRVLQAPTLAQGLTEATRGTHAQVLLLGRSRDRWPWARVGHSTANELLRRGLDTRIEVVDEGLNQSQPHAFHSTGFGAMVGTLSVLAASSGLAWLVPREGNIAMVLPVYLAAVTFIAHRWGQGLAVLASVLSTLFYSFLLETPRFNQGGAPWPNLLFFLAMLLAAQAVMGLLHRLRQQAREVQRREVHTASLYLLGRALARCSGIDQVGVIAAEHIRRVFKVEACLLFPAQGGWRAAPPPSLDPGLPPPAELLPRLEVGERLGDPLEPLALGRTYCLSLSGTDRSEGVLQILPRDAAGLPSETWELLKAFAVQIALALERLRWLEEARKAQVESETERMRSTLLGAIGHDLRTPLAAIHGAAGTLLLPSEVSESTRRDLLSMIQDESERLAHLLGNLLDLTRLESGAIHVQKEWQPLEEVVGSALGRLEKRQGPLPLRVDLPEALPLVPLDAALIEQLLVNLLTNAQRHAPGQAMDLRAWEDPGRVHIEVADRGPGIPEGFEERIFDKFFRLPEAGEGGVGLGLAICRAIVQAHGGTIHAENRPGGGSSFRVALPLDGIPPAPPEPVEGAL
ncbi:ATP-binding protein [Geothrix sp. PMB-07]|uniref:ATP-binding protein n=1 Tax=Geothrix sp. PMB-07 TaxID=3068640 RepID=UPI002741B58F|nr:ATP-binding protein [Geothrix sp. PMB-07]WLT32502.1 ATP-binding protein [Geothrix sp. PMB-07]